MRHITLCLFVLITLAGCVDRGPVIVTPDIAPYGWSDEVVGAVQEWRFALEARGCPPLVEIGDDGIAIRWAARVSEDDFGIVYTADEVRILDRKLVGGEYRGVILHALGTLAGVDVGGGGVMGENLCKLPDALTEEDVVAAMRALGC